MEVEKRDEVLRKLRLIHLALGALCGSDGLGAEVGDGDLALDTAHILVGDVLAIVEELEPVEICSYTGDVTSTRSGDF